MDRREKNVKKVSYAGIMDLPEQILRQIFNYLDLITLYVSLQEVCHEMKIYVSRFIGTGGIFLLIGNPQSPPELLFIFTRPSGKFNVERKSIAPITCDGKRQHFGYLCGNLCPPFQPKSEYGLYYYSWNDSIIACAGEGHLMCSADQHPLYQYQFITDSWEIIFRNISFCDPRPSCQHPVNFSEGTYLSHVNSKSISQNSFPRLDISINNDTGVVNRAKFCKAKTFIENLKENDDLYNYSVVCSPPNRIYLVGGFWRHQKVDGPKRLKMHDKLIYPSEEIIINRAVLIEELISGKLNKIKKSSYLDDMPYRSKPLSFILNNNLYLAGHVPCSDCTSVDHEHGKFFLNSVSSHLDENDCKCCDRIDLSNEKYYHNVHSMPYSLKRVTLPKITRNKDESLAVISFYDPLDFQDKVWTFTEDTGFVEHCDLASEVCFECKKNYNANHSYYFHSSEFSSNCSMYNHLSSCPSSPSISHRSFCTSSKKQLLKIK